MLCVGVAASLTPSSFTIDPAQPVFTTDSAFLGVNIDSASLYQSTRLDFADTDFRALAKRLGGALPNAPMTLRLGGSSADDLTWGHADGKILMSDEVWDSLQSFVAHAGFNLAWDLNGMRSRANDGSWDTTDAATLLKRVQAKNQSIWALQLGNEPGHFLTRNEGAPTAKVHGADFVRLKGLLAEVYVKNRPRIQGPDVCHGEGTNDSPCANFSYVRELLEAAGPKTLDDLTVHSYGLTGPGKPGSGCSVATFLDPSSWQRTPSILQEYANLRQELAPDAKLVLSETATTGDGGCPGLSNRFVAGFYFVDILGATGEIGVWQVYRQDFAGFSGINGGSSCNRDGPRTWDPRPTTRP